MAKVPSYRPKYNSARDIKKVNPIGALDLKSAFANNAIPSNLAVSDGKYNGVDNPDGIATRVRNRIDAEVLDKSIRDYKPESNE